MISEQKTSQESFNAFLEACYSELPQNDLLQKIRLKAWDQYQELGLPSRQNEVFKYIRLKAFFALSLEKLFPTELPESGINPHILPECAQSVLVFVNGSFSSSLSRLDALPKGVIAISLAEAMSTFGTFLTGQWAKAIKEETDPFVAINAALHPKGAFLYVPPKLSIEPHVQILNILDPVQPFFTMPRLHAFIGSQSQLSLLTTQIPFSEETIASNSVIDLSLEENAHVKLYQLAVGLSKNVWHFDALRASLKRNSTLKTVTVTAGSSTIRNDYRISLQGENAEASLNGVAMLSDTREAHSHVLMDHQAPHCKSMQLFKNVLNESSRSSFEGKILVRQAAQKTEAFQLNNNLLLSDRANADSKPNLEIFADDVKASHGATVGQLDKEHLFYMKTRGFSDSAAKSLLVNGFCQEIIDMIPPSFARKFLKERVSYYLSL